MALLEINHIKKNFGGIKAIADFSLKAEKGEIHGIIGPNGAGKTTIFNTFPVSIRQIPVLSFWMEKTSPGFPNTK